MEADAQVTLKALYLLHNTPVTSRERKKEWLIPVVSSSLHKVAPPSLINGHCVPGTFENDILYQQLTNHESTITYIHKKSFTFVPKEL